MSTTPRRQQFIADLWFVFALLTPLFTPMLLIYLTPAHQSTLPHGLCRVLEMLLTGPLSVLRVSSHYAVDFITLCALPTLFVSIHALALRMMVTRERAASSLRFLSALGLLVLAHLCIFGVSVWCAEVPVARSSDVMLWWCSSMVVYAATTSLWVLYRPIRAHGFELILGLMLMEHLAVPVIGHLLF